jgi:hypothetical protein
MTTSLAAQSRPSVTFLFCVESGYIEGQIPLAIEGLRRFGGGLADAPILIVTPRYGPTLERKTLSAIQDLGAKYVRRKLRDSSDWYVYMNKAWSAQLAEELAETEQVIWLDADTLVVSEPSLLVLRAGEDFACASIDKNVGSTGPDDPCETYWQALSSHYGLPIDALPWVETEHDRQRVRFRLHSGVYSFRRNAGLGRAFVGAMQSMLDSRIAFSRKLPLPGDDVALAFAVVQLQLNWRLLPMFCNYEMTPTSRYYRRAEAQTAQILHYHHALSSPDGASWFLGELETFRPDVADWLRPRTPLLTRPGGFRRRVMRRFLQSLRSRRQALYEASCQITVQEPI